MISENLRPVFHNPTKNVLWKCVNVLNFKNFPKLRWRFEQVSTGQLAGLSTLI
jgi:hypothetical protein